MNAGGDGILATKGAESERVKTVVANIAATGFFGRGIGGKGVSNCGILPNGQRKIPLALNGFSPSDPGSL
jgi:hypothetical protein